MRVRKALLFFLVFLLGAVLGEPLALGGVGLFAKIYFFFGHKTHFSYQSIDWYEGKIIFREVDLNCSNVFTCHAKQIQVSLRPQHVQIDEPKISILKVLFVQPGSRLFGNTMFHVENGTIDKEGMGEIQFSCERTWPHQIGRFAFKKGESQWDIEAYREGDEIFLYANLHQFDTALLQEWIDLKGDASGRIQLTCKEGKWQRSSGHLDICGGGYQKIAEQIKATIDWEGDVASLAGRCRLSLEEGVIQGKTGRITKIRGDGTFTSDLGATWDFQAEGSSREETFPIACQGKAFLHPSRPQWISSDASLGKAKICLHAEEESGSFLWKGAVRDIGPAEGTLIQSLSLFFDERLEEIDFQQGRVAIEGSLHGINTWALALSALDLRCMQEGIQVACEEATGHFSSESLVPSHKSFTEINPSFPVQRCARAQQLDASCLRAPHNAERENLGVNSLKNFCGRVLGTFSFSKASFEFPGFDERGVDWSGKGEIANGALTSSLFTGKIETTLSDFCGEHTLSMIGHPEAFQAKVSGPEGHLSVLCGWKDKTLDWRIQEGVFQGLFFQGNGTVEKGGEFALHLDAFQGSAASICRILNMEGGSSCQIESVGEGFSATGTAGYWEWAFQAKAKLRDGIECYIPLVEKKGDLISFDLHFENQSWDSIRLCGVWDGLCCSFDPDRTHLLGSKVSIPSCKWGQKEGLQELSFQTKLPLQQLFKASSKWIPNWIQMPLEGDASLNVFFAKDGGSFFSIDGEELDWNQKPFPLHIEAYEEKGEWHFSSCQIDPFILSGTMHKEGKTFRISSGSIQCKECGEANFSGLIDPSLQCAFYFPQFKVDLGLLHLLPFFTSLPTVEAEGMLEGSGCVSWRGKWEADFDLIPSDLTVHAIHLENVGPIHLSYASDGAVLCSGLNLQIPERDLHCKMDLLQYDPFGRLWTFRHCRIDLPPAFLHDLPQCPKPLESFDLTAGLDLIADLECSSDLSHFSCFVKEGQIPFGQKIHTVKDLFYSFEGNRTQLDFQYLHEIQPIHVAIEAIGTEENQFSGRLQLEEIGSPREAEERPLSIVWTYGEETGFSIREIEGQCGGIDASFHALDTSLIGSARIHFGLLSKFLPSRLATLFSDLKMGKGYELKGRLHLTESYPIFEGILSGKQMDLFGYQLRTLLCQVELGVDKVRIYDLKISDSAGCMTIDSIEAMGTEEVPWTISMPRLSISEFRPSLLQKEGTPGEPAGPLVVRELKLEGFRGLLDEAHTYKASGELQFINSYRREHTVFDLPSDVLGRIVGLDLELLIPVRGTLRYELKDGMFYLKELRDAYSEADRSQFFLIPDPIPVMDLDGNLRILVNMKQFVLFKFTESFLISIDGKLDDPQFHLQKKRRFLGL